MAMRESFIMVEIHVLKQYMSISIPYDVLIRLAYIDGLD